MVERVVSVKISVIFLLMMMYFPKNLQYYRAKFPCWFSYVFSYFKFRFHKSLVVAGSLVPESAMYLYVPLVTLLAQLSIRTDWELRLSIVNVDSVMEIPVLTNRMIKVH